jgi:hypothetical protein
MTGHSGIATRAAACGAGAVAGFLIASHLGVNLGPPSEDVLVRLFSGISGFKWLFLSIAIGAALGYLIGRDVGRRATGPWAAVAAVGAVAGVGLASLAGIAVGSEVASFVSSRLAAQPKPPTIAPHGGLFDGLGSGLDAYVRREQYRWWGALAGALAGYGLFRWAWAVRAEQAARSAPDAELAAENERLRDEVARLREGRA